MSAVRGLAPPSLAAPVVVADDEYVVPEHLAIGNAARGPRLGDDVWDFRPFVPHTARHTRCLFTTLPDEIAVRTVKDYLYSRLRRGGASGDVTARPAKLTTMVDAFQRVRIVLATLRGLGAPRLADVTQTHLDAALTQWKMISPKAAEVAVGALKHLAAHGAFLTQDRLPVQPWLGRSSHAVAGLRRDTENSTARIPERFIGPLIRAAVFYVDTAAQDLLAAQRRLADLETDRVARRGPGETDAAVREFIAQRRAEGRGIPAVPLHQVHMCPGPPAVVDGVVQSPNGRLVALLTGNRNAGRYKGLLVEAAQELGYEPGSLGTPISPWPGTGRQWTPGLDPYTLHREFAYLRTACWIVIAYLSGMRDTEVRELSRDCAFTEPGDDGRPRHKIRGRVFKGRKVTGDEAEWVVLEPVHRAVEVLLEINDDPSHLFGYRAGTGGYVILTLINRQLARFRDHVNDLFSTADGPFIPSDTAGSNAGNPGAGVPWAFDTRQFRRTLAWHIAHQPFGIVAGARQYQHTKFAVFEGYAGTSASGFAAEVAAEEAVAKLDYLEDLYRDWNDGGRAGGGSVQKINAEFARIRRELGDLPGVVATPARLRTMLEHITRILHPGVLNDCFYQPATAVCSKRAKSLGRPLPMLNMCSACPNARRTAVHLPRLLTARDQALQALQAGELLPLQRVALTEHAASFAPLIADLQAYGVPTS